MSYLINDREDYVTKKEFDYHKDIYKKFNDKVQEIKDEFYYNYDSTYGKYTVISKSSVYDKSFSISIGESSFQNKPIIYFSEKELKKIGILCDITSFVERNTVIFNAYSKSSVYYMFKYLKDNIPIFETSKEFIKKNKDKVVNISEFDNEIYFKDTYKIINDLKEKKLI